MEAREYKQEEEFSRTLTLASHHVFFPVPAPFSTTPDTLGPKDPSISGNEGEQLEQADTNFASQSVKFEFRLLNIEF